MALLEKQLIVKTSTIPGSGNGLFTTEFIPKGTRVVEYKGRITTWKDVEKDWKNGYIYTVNRNLVIDAGRTLKALARYANDARGLTRVKGITNNCTYVNDGRRAFIETTKDIPAGAELFVDYGRDYWVTMRENLKIDKGEAAKKKSTPRKRKTA